MKETKMISIEKIVPNPYQPRLEFNSECVVRIVAVHS